jgi:hypothetical protein
MVTSSIHTGSTFDTCWQWTLDGRTFPAFLEEVRPLPSIFDYGAANLTSDVLQSCASMASADWKS